MSKTFKPMLAASMDSDAGQSIKTLRYPLIASPKFDGIRCLILDGKPVSRTLKDIPNRFVQSQLTAANLQGLDGELMVGETFQAVTSGIMTEGFTPDFAFHVFDDFSQVGRTYQERLYVLRDRVRALGHPRIKFVATVRISDADELEAYTEQELAKGYEGVMVRRPDGPYRFGRSTWNEGFLVKVKPFEDAEATVVGFEEQMHNGNEAQQDAFGRTKRSSHQANLTPKGTLGALVCSCPLFSETFKIGTGFDDKTKLAIWNDRPGWLAAMIKFRYQKIGSTKERPRIPVFLGRRDPRDLSSDEKS